MDVDPQLDALRQEVQQLEAELGQLEAELEADAQALAVLSGEQRPQSAQPALAQPPPLDETMYHWPGALVLSILLMTFAFVGAGGAYASWPLIVVGAACALLWGYMLRFPSRLAMNEEGLLIRNQHQAPVRMSWRDIEDVTWTDGTQGTPPRISVKRNGAWTDIGGPQAPAHVRAAAGMWVAYAKSRAGSRIAVPPMEQAASADETALAEQEQDVHEQALRAQQERRL